MRKGSITVFLALAFPLIVVLLFTLFESARYAGLRSVARIAGNSAADSVFAEYDRTLFDEYGVLFLDGGRNRGTIRTGDLCDRFQYFFRENVPSPGAFGGGFLSPDPESVSITEFVTATDYNGEVFIRSVLDFYKYDVVGSIVDQVKEEWDKAQEGGSLKDGYDKNRDELKNTDWSKSVSKAGSSRIYASGKQKRSDRDLPIRRSGKDGAKEESEPIDDKKLKKEIDDSVIGKSDSVKASGWLALVIPSGTSVSGYEMDQDDAPSLVSRDERTIDGDGFFAETAESLGFYEYVLSHFSDYTNQAHQNGMQYEIEYVLFGKRSDTDNLKTVLNRIMWIREGMNLLYLVTSSHRSEANALAETLVGWTGNQLIVLLTEAALLSAWAYAESIVDVRALLQNKKVAFVKTDESFVLSLSGVENLLAGGGEGAKEEETGMKYEDYLRLLLYTSDVHTSAYRVMDLMQDRMRASSPNFLMSSEIYAMEVRVDVTAKELFTALPVSVHRALFKREYTFSETYSIVY